MSQFSGIQPFCPGQIGSGWSICGLDLAGGPNLEPRVDATCPRTMRTGVGDNLATTQACRAEMGLDLNPTWPCKGREHCLALIQTLGHGRGHGRAPTKACGTEKGQGPTPIQLQREEGAWPNPSLWEGKGAWLNPGSIAGGRGEGGMA